MVLENLDNVPWTSLKHAYGGAEDTPKYLRLLTSSNPSDQEKAFNHLYSTLYYQGSVYTAAVAAVPFMIEILQESTIKHKHFTLDLLSSLAAVGSFHNNHQHLFLFKDVRETPEFKARFQEELNWVADLRTELEKHLPVYCLMLDDNEKLNRLYVSHLLSVLPDLRERSIPELINHLKTENDPQVRANILHVLGKLDYANQQALFEEFWRSEKNRLPQCVALAWFTTCSGVQTPEEALNALVEILLTADEGMIGEYEELPSVGRFTPNMAIPVAIASSKYAERILPWYTKQVMRSNFVGDNFGIGLLVVALRPQGKIANINHLSGSQCQAIIAIAKKAWLTPNSIYGNMIDVLRMFGLPDTKEEIDQLVRLNLNRSHG
ncbi:MULTISPECIES: HEAT repeat domain-containing protein [Moorena]|uniref:HEAT repeat domain-containing protein n=1 Tax=Moorena producens 3L TaxID=489825 RepID=F4XKK7_9CYAN|nr:MULTISPECIES: HEAT repeat domain-containing protein [Moorena]NES83427.1 HEAT repeat domain-containing protein [Moorena sp. SIO2B7]EGJ34862.1 hypothetical protein LYNGBM3L_11560 [Moorena producens 3L]NEP34419.1 HEAT repeat domain-containing protein [Moorena sp. SIO3B2]NEP68448.1 HEAT repeat domain-containing protein [Moorena sp. SIO3A5]NEQ08184.1 HEAT repeat domain-containing protein [Moorena sp. SIO4E2]